MYPEYFHGNYFWWFMPLIHLAGFIIFITILCFIIRGIFGGGRDCQRNSETPLDILKKRYAKGDITREEYQRMKDDINK